MVDVIVDDKEPIVRLIERLDVDGRILGVVTGKIQLQLLRDLLGIDGGRNSCTPLVKQGQHGFVNVVVEKDDFPCRLFDQAANETICIEYLAFEEDALLGFQLSFFKLVV